MDGSKDDPMPLGPLKKEGWISLWKKKTEWDDNIYGKVWCCICGHEDGWTDEWGRTHIMVGGHIVLGPEEDVAARSGAAFKKAGNLMGGNRVFIAPICSKCNGQSGNMQVLRANKIVQLCGFGYDADGQREVDREMWDEEMARIERGQREIARNDCQYKRIYFERVGEYRRKVADIVRRQARLTGWDYDYLNSSATSSTSTIAGVSVQSVSSTPANSRTSLRPLRHIIPNDVRYNYGPTGFYYPKP